MAGEETTNQSNIKPESNMATTGMNMDLAVGQIPKGTLTYALNAALENFDANSVNYQNEPGNEFCLQFPDGYQLIGNHLIAEKNKHIFFLTNPNTGDSEIGYMDNNDCIYHTLVNAPCLNFNIHYPIHKAVHKLTNCTTEIYWTDGYNPRRFLDIDNIPYIQSPTSDPCNPIYTDQLDCNQIKVQPNFQIPNLEVTDVRTGGDLKAGTYQFAIQYASSLGDAYTSYYSVTNPTPISNLQITTPNFDYPVGKSIELTISNIELSGIFQYFNVAVIKTINDIASVELIGTYFIENATQKIIYTGQSKTDIRLTVDDIFLKYPYYDIAGDITTASDVLIWDQLTSIDRINYQQIASNITLQWETWRIPANENYADELNATNLRGYLRDEVYAFEIVFLLSNGKQTDGFHIPGRVSNYNDDFYVPSTNADFIGEPDYSVGPIGYKKNWKIYNTGSVTGFSPQYTGGTDYKGPYQYGEFAYWESIEKYPCNEALWGDLADQPIRHHKFPDVLVSPVYESAIFTTPSNMAMQKDAVFPIGVKIDVAQVSSLISSSNLTQAQKDEIVGFKIIRGDRSANKSIVAKGILRNVASYNREGTDYYFPNYPYNDLRKDPFLLTSSNSYSITAGSNVGSDIICRTFNIYVTGNAQVRYTDCTTLNPVTIDVSAVAPTQICCLDFPKPELILPPGIVGVVVSDTYVVYKLTSTDPGGTTFKFYNPLNLSHSSCLWNTYTGNVAALPPGYNSWGEYCLTHSTNSCCKPDPDFTTEITVYSTTGPRYVWALSMPYYDSGGEEYYIEQISVSGGNCDPTPLDTYASEASKYRMVFNSPETSFGQPFLGNILKLENVMFGAGKAHFVQVKKNAMYRLISKEAQSDALNSANGIASITGSGVNYNATALFAAYQAYLTIYINGITRNNYGYSFNSIASYDYSNSVNNSAVDTMGYLGVKQRQLDIAQYLIPGVQSVNDNHNINNYQRESSVYLKTSDVSKSVSRTYTTFRICNTNVTPLSQTFQYTDPTIGTTTVTLLAGNCATVDSYTYPVETVGNTSFTITQISQSQTTVIVNTPPLPFAEDTPTMIASGASLVVDNSRYTPSEINNCSKPGQERNINVISYYGSLKNIFENQWGQIYSYDTVDTGFQRDITPVLAPVSATIFGGDTFISKFAFKTKLPFFIDNRVGAPDDSDIFYDELGNVGYPKYWHSARSVLSNASVNSVTLKNFISIKAHNFDCPNSQTSSVGLGRTYYDGNMYMFAYGVPYFYCESSYNVDLRQAFNIKEGDFWPHVSTAIPDDWVQESYVSIANDNTYYYNVTYSKQNRENSFSHLPADWSNICYTNYPFRAVYSDAQDSSPDNRTNNWLTYLPVSYFDFPRNYGNLISLDGIQNKGVLARFENKSLLYNTLLTVDTSNPKAAYMGNDMLFKSSPPIDFAETDLGYVGSQHKMLLKIPQGQITVDAKRGQVFLIAGNQAEDLSAFGSGMNRFFTDHLAFEILRHFPDADIDNHFNGIGLHGVYDSKYDRVIISKLDYIPQPNKDVKYDPVTREFYIETSPLPGAVIRNTVELTDEEYFCNKSWTLSFNVNTKSWVSFHSYIPNFYIAENNFFYSGQNDCCSTFDAVVATIEPQPGRTTTTTTTTSTSSTTTTTTTTTVFTGCDLDGTIVELLCDLAGDAVEIYVTTTTTTTAACDCHAGTITDNNVYYYTDCTGAYKSNSGASTELICFDISKAYSENIQDDGTSLSCICGPSTTTTTTTSTTTTTTTTCYCVNASFIIYQSDIDAAAGNTNPALDGKVFFNYVGCDGVAGQVSFSEAGTYGNNICVCSIDANGFYYTSNVHYPAFSVASVGSPCIPIL